MDIVPRASTGPVRRIILNPSFWLLAAMLVSGVLLHYSAQVRALPVTVTGQAQLTRHATERVLLILPIGYAAFTLGPVTGLVTLVMSLLIMLPRVILLSPNPADAFIETIAVTLVGSLTIWLAWIRQTQERLREKATARLQAINAVSSVLTGSLELRRVLREALDAVLEVTSLDAGLVFVLDERAEDLIVAAHRGLPPVLVGSGRGLKLARMLVADPALESQIALPLKSKGRPLGVLIVGRRGTHEFQLEEVDLLTSIASHISVAMDNARLHQDVARQLERERRLGEVAKEITSELELDRVLSKVVLIAEELVSADAGGIALLDEDRGIITYPYLHNLPIELSQVPMSPDEGLAGRVTTSGRPAVLEDYQAYPANMAVFCKGGVKSALGVPIVSGEKVFGALDLFTLTQKRSFSDRDIAVVSGVARQAAVAIENARLYKSMRSYARQIITAQEEERKRMARELHDDTAQALVGLSRRLDALLSGSDQVPETLRQRIAEIRQLTAEISHGVRRFSHDLRPSTLDDLGLLPTLDGLTTRMSQEDGLPAELRVLGKQRRLPPEVELVLFRIVQEALTNVRKHSRATEVTTTVEFRDGLVTVTISDNGRGFTLPERPGNLVETGRLGLTGMFERAQLVGGTLTVQSELGKGTTVIAEIPV
jgi:signal transduction histidine kinase